MRLVTTYLEELTAHGKSPATLAITERWLAHFEEFCRREELTRDQPATFERYRQELLWRPGANSRLYAANTVDQALRTVRSFLRWLVSRGLLEKDPTRSVELHRPQSARRAPSAEEQARALAQPDRSTPLGLRDRALLRLLFEPGISRSRLAALDTDDVCLAERLVHVRGGRRAGVHPLTDPAIADVAAYLELGRPALVASQSSALLLTRDGHRMSVPAVARAVRLHAAVAGLTFSF